MATNTYNLIPHLRITGERYLLMWHTEWEQHQLFIGKTLEQITNMWKTALKKNKTDATLKSLWKASIVLPSVWICDKYADDCYKGELYNFKVHTAYSINNYIKDNHKLPPNVKRCKQFIADINADYIDEKEHYGCKNCYNRIILTTNTWEELFWKNSPKHKVKEPFDGVMADDSKDIYVCRLDGGDHNRGIGFEKVLTETQLGDMFNTSPLFFFHGEQIDIPEPLLELRNVLVAEEKARAKLDKIRQQEKWEKTTAERYNDLEKLLRG